jgi:hypothetical protein
MWIGWSVGVGDAPVEGEVRARDQTRHPSGWGVVVDVEDALAESIPAWDVGAELGARNVEVAGEDLAGGVAREEVVEVAGAEDREEVDREEQVEKCARVR